MQAALGIHEGEGLLFFLLVLANMLMGITRNFAYTSANAIFLDRFGSEGLPYLAIMSCILSPSLATVYMRLEKQLSFRQMLIVASLLQLAYLVVVRVLLASTDAGWVVYATALSIDVIYFCSGMLYWGLAGMLCDVRQAKRLFPLIGSGEWVICVIVGFATPMIVGLMGTQNMLWVAALGVAATVLVMLYTLKRFRPASSDDAEPEETTSSPAPSGLSILKNPYVFFMLLNNALSTIGVQFVDNVFYSLVEIRYPSADEVAGFIGVFWGCIGVIILLCRSFVTSRMLALFGVNVGLLALPVAVLTGIVAFAVLGTTLGIETAVCFWMIVGTRFFDACLRNDLDAAAGLILYQPLPSSQKSLAQAMNDGVFVPVAIGISGGLLLLIKKVWGFGALEIAYVLPLAIVPWIISGFSVTRRYPAMVAAAIAGHRYDSAALSLN